MVTRAPQNHKTYGASKRTRNYTSVIRARNLHSIDCQVWLGSFSVGSFAWDLSLKNLRSVSCLCPLARTCPIARLAHDLICRVIKVNPVFKYHENSMEIPRNTKKLLVLLISVMQSQGGAHRCGQNCNTEGPYSVGDVGGAAGRGAWGRSARRGKGVWG